MNPLTPIETALQWVVDHLHDNANLSYGWSIVVLVLLVRFALLPLMVKQYRSMRRMQAMAPQLKELQAKYKGDRAKQQEEMMRFYQENNINPFASCAPMLVQMPIFFALYYVLRDFARGAEGTAHGFMGVIPDITKNISELGLASSVVIGLVYGGSQLLSSELSFEPTTPDIQKRMMRVLPLIIVVMAFQFPFPAGLAIYWVTSNLFTAAQQLFIRHKIEHDMEEHPEEFQTGKRSSRTASAKVVNPPVPARKSRSRSADAPAEEPTEEAQREGGDGPMDLDEGGAPAEPVSSPPAKQKSGNNQLPRRRPPSGGGKNRPGQRRSPKKRR
ncbi:MAG: membrane protein insertase YidC [Thermoleophilia bacterium]|nr:membrane protein insertase YidC [Thermoleophilia bacterium]